MNVGKAYNFHSLVKRFFHTEAQRHRGNVAQQKHERIRVIRENPRSMPLNSANLAKLAKIL